MWINPSCYSVQENWFWKCFLSNEPLHKILLSAKVNLNLILELPYALYSVYTPVGMVGLAEYVCTHHILNFLQRKTQTSFLTTSSRVPSCTQPCLWIRVTHRSYRMAQYSDDFLFILNIIVCVDCNPRDSGASLLTTA